MSGNKKIMAAMVILWAVAIASPLVLAQQGCSWAIDYFQHQSTCEAQGGGKWAVTLHGDRHDPEDGTIKALLNTKQCGEDLEVDEFCPSEIEPDDPLWTRSCEVDSSGNYNVQAQLWDALIERASSAGTIGCQQ